MVFRAYKYDPHFEKKKRTFCPALYNAYTVCNLAKFLRFFFNFVFFEIFLKFREIQNYFVKISCFALARIKPPLWVY